MNKVLTMLGLLVLSGGALAQDFTQLYPDVQAMQKARSNANKGDYRDAHEYYLEAAEYGNKEAQKLIGLQYLDGQGVDADAARAHAWLRLASTHNDPRITGSFKELDATLSDEARAAAEKHYKTISKEYGDKQALKKRKKWTRKELRSTAGKGRPNPMEQTQIQIDGRYFRINMGDLMDALDSYVDDFEAKMEG